VTEQTPYQNVTFPSNGGSAHGYLAVPGSGTGPGIIVIQEWWGLDSHIADVCNRFARAGFVALAPDLFGGRVAHNEDEAMTLAGQLSPAQAVTELSGAVDYLLAQPSVTGDAVGVVGFCMGGAFVLHLAARAGETVAAAVVFYGTFQGGEDFSGIRAPVQGHFGEHDQFIPPGRAREVMEMVRAQAGVPVEVHFYDAGHAFFNDQNHLGTYNEDLARLAWDRTVDFLRSHLTASLSRRRPSARRVGRGSTAAWRGSLVARLGRSWPLRSACYRSSLRARSQVVERFPAWPQAPLTWRRPGQRSHGAVMVPPLVPC
jgi:carboxymethylenebutenolidase